MDVKFDLLGDPIPDNFGKRGRPPHIVTDEKRKLVIQLLAFDWEDEEIAASLSITKPTLKKHYFSQLKVRDEARSRVKGKLIASLMAEVEKGNISAIAKYFDRLDKHERKVLAQALASKPKQTKEQPLGKKEQARQHAASLSGKFAPPPPPKLHS